MKRKLYRNNPSNEDLIKYDSKLVFDAWMANYQIANTAYPIAHNETFNHYKIEQSNMQQYCIKSRNWIKEIWVYVHIPFCENRCFYCEYCVVDPKLNEQLENVYVESLLKEIQIYSNLINTKNIRISWFDIWWWTPTYISIKNIEKIIKKIYECFDISQQFEISIETTPKIVANNPEKIKQLYDLWIRRISMWVQTISPVILASMNRDNSSISWNFKAVENIRNAWFKKFNVDIMYWLIWQDEQTTFSTLNHVFSLMPEFITLYSTRYKWTKIQNIWYKIEKDIIYNQYNQLRELLIENWYFWENWKNTFSKIIWDYWTSDYLTNRVIKWTPYIWFWLWAQSYNHKALYYNQWAASKNMAKYLTDINKEKLPIQDFYYLSKNASIWKFTSVSFYFWAINTKYFNKNFQQKIEKLFWDELKFLLENWLIYRDNENFRLTNIWVKNINWVISLFYSPAIQNYLIKNYLKTNQIIWQNLPTYYWVESVMPNVHIV